MGRFFALVYGVVCYAIFFLTFLYLIGFVGNLYVPRSVDVGPPGGMGEAVLVDLLLIALFGIQHSVMARPRFKRWLTGVVPAPIERSTFVLVASLVLILLYWQWRPIPQVVWAVSSPAAVGLLWGLFALGFGLVLAATFVIDHFELFGLRQVWLNLMQRPPQHPQFRVTWFYKFVRHPLYLGFLLALWSTPTMTLGHLLFAAGMTVYIFIGIHYEERDLTRFLGDDYRRYQARVPMLAPRLGRIHETVKPRHSRPATGG